MNNKVDIILKKIEKGEINTFTELYDEITNDKITTKTFVELVDKMIKKKNLDCYRNR